MNDFDTFRYANLFAVLIDTWWNVNFVGGEVCELVNEVLIDTWWNVNLIPINVENPPEWVLIDTWWNVNLDGYRGEDCLILGFNRYMVECEFYKNGRLYSKCTKF